MQTLIDLFTTFAEQGDTIAFVNRTGIRRVEVSYRQFHLLVLKMAHLLEQNGVAQGDRVLLWGPNSSWWAVAYWGIIIRGAVAVPVDFMSDPERAESIRILTSSDVVIQSRNKTNRLTTGTSLLLEDLHYLLEDNASTSQPVSVAAEDTAQLVYTSGTTGNPKGVILSHKNLLANIVQIHQQVPIITSCFNFLSLLPLSHSFEMMGGFLVPLYRGAKVIYLRSLKPSAIMSALHEENIYVIMAVPRLMQLLQTSLERELEGKFLASIFGSLLQVASRFPLRLRRLLFYPVQSRFGSNFTVFVSGGAPLSPDVFNFWKSMGFIVLEGYGLTETSPVLCVNTMAHQVAGSVGPPLPGVRIKIVEKEVLVRGDNIFPGYYRNMQATRDAFTDDGWFHTGDLGEFDQRGWLTIKGREKELIVTGAGVNVYPDELEAVLNGIPGVKESCVIGVERGGGEEVHAVLLLAESGVVPENVIAQANSHLDAMHQITGFTLWPETEFPKTTTLKIKKFAVKEVIESSSQKGGASVAADSLINLLAKITGTGADRIREESLLIADLGLTSIDLVELDNVLEQEYRLDIDESLIGQQTRVADLRQMIAGRGKTTHQDHFRFRTNNRFFRVVRMVWDAIFHYPLFRSMVTLDVIGADNLEKLPGPVLFVSNHVSYLDQPAIMFALPSNIRYRTATAAWEEFFFNNYHGVNRIVRQMCFHYASLLLNLFPLPQSHGFRGSLAYMGKLADAGINTLLFPEGEHSRDGQMHGFHLGLGTMVKELDIPVVPIWVSGTFQVLPHGATFPKHGNVTVTFGEPLRFRFEEPSAIVAITRQAVESLSHQGELS